MRTTPARAAGLRDGAPRRSPLRRAAVLRPSLRISSPKMSEHEANDDDVSDLINIFGLADDPSPRSVPRQGVRELAHPLLQLPWRPSADVKLATAQPHALEHLMHFSSQAKKDGGHVVNHLCVECGGVAYSASIIHMRHQNLRIPRQAHDDAVLDAQALPLTTGEVLYIPSTYTMLAHLLPQRGMLLSDRRIAELGAGLGLTSSILQNVIPAPARLVVTDGDDAVLPLLRANLEANRCGMIIGKGKQSTGGGTVTPECFKLLWGEQLPDSTRCCGGGANARPAAPLAAAFDLVVAADAVFSATPPQAAGSRLGRDTATESMVRGLFATAAALLDPRASDPPARLVLTCEPRDRLKPGTADPLRALVPQLAEAAGFRFVEWAPRRLIGVAQPDWLTDVLVFELAELAEASHEAATPPTLDPDARPQRVQASPDAVPYNHDDSEWRGPRVARQRRAPEEARQAAA